MFKLELESYFLFYSYIFPVFSVFSVFSVYFAS